MREITPLNYYNVKGCEILDEKLFGSTPTGFLNFNNSKYTWAKKSYDYMIQCFWTMDEVNTSTASKDFSMLTDNEKAIVKYTFGQLSFNDSIQSVSLMDFARQTSNTIVKAALIKQAETEVLHCLKAGTEILTANGFMDFRELDYDDKVAAYNTDGTIHFEQPSDIINSNYEGEMYKFQQTNYCQIVTPNHRMVTRYSDYQRNKDRGSAGKLMVTLAEEAKINGHNLPIAGRATGELQLTDMDRLAIAVQADGSVLNRHWIKKKGYDIYDYKQENGQYAYILSFKRQDKIERLEKLIKNTGIKHTRSTSASGYTTFYIWVDSKFDKTFDWVKLDEISFEFAKDFIDETKHWDGSVRDKGSICYTNTNKKAIDKYMAVAALAECQVGLYYMDPAVSKGCNLIDMWQVHTVPNKPNKSGRELKKEKLEYNGTIHCVTVTTGMIVCRYEGSIFVTGNSASYATLLDATGNSEEVFNLYKHDDALSAKNEAIAVLYARYINSGTASDMLLDAVVNVCLEGIFFQTGFAFIYVIGDKLPSARDTIVLIQRDELTHMAMFSQITKTIGKENNLFNPKVINMIEDIFNEAVNIELTYAKYLMERFPIMGLSYDEVERTTKNYANARLKAIGLKPIFPLAPITNLQRLVARGEDLNSTKTNFFEGTAKNYAKSGLDMDDF